MSIKTLPFFDTERMCGVVLFAFVVCVLAQQQRPFDGSVWPAVFDSAVVYDIGATIVVSVNRSVAPAAGAAPLTIACRAFA
jgi:hypothetical protein